MKNKLIVISFILYSGLCLANTTEVCFTPHGNCTNLLVSKINNAKSQVLVQAYSFTSKPIAQALVEAHKRGLNVLIILDKSQIKSRYSQIHYLYHNHIKIWIDYKPAIAHNKVMMIDGCTLETGSFNYTASAQKRNAENMLFINDCMLTNKYAINWYNRLSVSRKYQEKNT